MLLPKGAFVAVVDGESFSLFHNTGDEANPKLAGQASVAVDDDHPGSGGHRNSSANPDQSQVNEDGHAAGVAELLNREVLTGKVANLVIIAAPRTLGELRKHYHQKLSAVLMLEIPKELSGHAVVEVEQAIAAA